MQVDVHKKLSCFYTTKKIPHENTRSIRIYFEIFLKWSYRLLGYTSLPHRCTFSHLLHLLNWRTKVVIIANSTQMSLQWTWTINYVCSSLIFLCLMNRTHFCNLLSELFSTLRLSEMLLLSINCLISIFASTLQISHKLRTINAQINIRGKKTRKLDTLANCFTVS